MQKLLTFFNKNIRVYAIFNDKNFNDTLTNDIVSFEQLGQGENKSGINHNWNDISLHKSGFYPHLRFLNTSSSFVS